MKQTFLSEVIEAIGLTPHLVAFLIISSTTSVVYYLNKVRNGEIFRWGNFFINITVSMVIAFGVDAFLRYFFKGSVDQNLEKFVMVFVGITANKIMELIEIHGGKYLQKKAKDLSGNYSKK